MAREMTPQDYRRSVRVPRTITNPKLSIPGKMLTDNSRLLMAGVVERIYKAVFPRKAILPSKEPRPFENDPGRKVLRYD